MLRVRGPAPRLSEIMHNAYITVSVDYTIILALGCPAYSGSLDPDYQVPPT